MDDILNRENKPDIAYNWYAGKDEMNSMPPLVFLGGFRSDKEGTKALFLENECKKKQQPYLRFDYRGHGRSGGLFEQSVLSDWLIDVEDIIAHCVQDKAILVGSSMGGWLAILYAVQNPAKIAGVIGLAAAPDFTNWMRQSLTTDHKEQLEKNGLFLLENDYGDPYPISKALLDDGDKNLLLDAAINIDAPVTLIQGKKDTDVPWQTAEKIKNRLIGQNNKIIYIDEADHRLSAPNELVILNNEVEEILKQV